MRTIHILRHAKAVRDDGALADHKRGLTRRGRAAAEMMAEFFIRNGISPDLVLCSDSTRTRETLALVEKGLGRPRKVEIRADLYLAEAHDLIDLIHDLDPGIRTIMLIGHNPGLEELAIGLTDSTSKQTSKDALKQIHEKFPTCALATLEANVATWSEIKGGKCALRKFVVPREIEPI